MFELTGTLTYVAPVMLAVLVAKTVADAIEPKGIYDLVIEYVVIFYHYPSKNSSVDSINYHIWITRLNIDGEDSKCPTW